MGSLGILMLVALGYIAYSAFYPGVREDQRKGGVIYGLIAMAILVFVAL